MINIHNDLNVCIISLINTHPRCCKEIFNVLPSVYSKINIYNDQNNFVASQKSVGTQRKIFLGNTLS
jgi:hypothetical protein